MFQVFLFCESAMIALWHRKQVETAFFSKYIQLCTKSSKVTRGGVFRLKNIVITSSTQRGDRWDQVVEMVLIKRGVSLNQASYQLWVDEQWNNCHAGKNQSYCCNCYCRGALTPQPDGNLQKKTRTKSFRALGETNVFAPFQHYSFPNFCSWMSCWWF